MIKEPVLKAIKAVEKQVVAILKSNKLITNESRTFDDAQLTDEARTRLKIREIMVPDKYIDQWRQLWPPKHKGERPVVAKKMRRFVNEHRVSLKQITAATKHHLSNFNPPYCGSANNFFYLYKREDNVTVSRCAEAIEQLKTSTVRTDAEGGHGENLIIDQDEW